MPPRTRQEPPRHPQELSKSAPRRLQGHTKRPPGAQEAARAAQEARRMVQEPPRVPQEASRITPRSLQEQAKRPLKPILKMPRRPQELRCCQERFISNVQGSSTWVGGTRECGNNYVWGAPSYQSHFRSGVASLGQGVAFCSSTYRAHTSISAIVLPALRIYIYIQQI